MNYPTPLGSHPDLDKDKDLTPRWLRIAFLIILCSALLAVLWGFKIANGLFLVSLGLRELLYLWYNRNIESGLLRNVFLIIVLVMIGCGVYSIIFKR